jgi:hypothetical protein
MSNDGRPTWFPDDPLKMLGEYLLGMDAPSTGAYMRLVYVAWLQTPPATIPDDDKWLWPRAGFADLSAWEGCKQTVLSGWTQRDGRYELPWLRKLYDTAAEKCNKNRRNGKKGADIKWSDSERHPSAKHPPSDREAFANTRASCSSSLSDSPSGYSEGGPGETALTPARLLPNHVRPLYDAYPKHQRGSMGDFQGALQDGAWAVLAARGEPDPLGVLLPIVRAYSESWAASRFTYGPRRFFEPQGVWTQDPSDWREPGQAAPVDFDKVAELASKGRRRSA